MAKKVAVTLIKGGARKPFSSVREAVLFLYGGNAKSNSGNFYKCLHRDGTIMGWKIEMGGAQTEKKKGSIKIDDLIEQNDIFKIVLNEAKKIEQGDAYLESVFVQMFVPRKPGYRAALEQEKMKDRRVKIGGKWYIINPLDLPKIKKLNILSNFES